MFLKLSFKIRHLQNTKNSTTLQVPYMLIFINTFLQILCFLVFFVLWNFFSLVTIIIFNYLCHNTKNGCSVVRCCEVL